MIYNTMENIFELTGDGGKTEKERIKEIFPEKTPLERLTIRLQLHNIVTRSQKYARKKALEEIEKDLIRMSTINMIRANKWIYPITG